MGRSRKKIEEVEEGVVWCGEWERKERERKAKKGKVESNQKLQIQQVI